MTDGPIPIARARRRRLGDEHAAEHVEACLDIAAEAAVSADLPLARFVALAERWYRHYQGRAAAPLRCPGCGALHPSETGEVPCCNRACNGEWGTGCYHCHHPSFE